MALASGVVGAMNETRSLVGDDGVVEFLQRGGVDLASEIGTPEIGNGEQTTVDIHHKPVLDEFVASLARIRRRSVDAGFHSFPRYTDGIEVARFIQRLQYSVVFRTHPLGGPPHFVRLCHANRHNISDVLTTTGYIPLFVSTIPSLAGKLPVDKVLVAWSLTEV